MKLKKMIEFAAGMKLAAVLLSVLAVGIGMATIIESAFGTPAARVLVYNASWFEFIILLLGINLLARMIKDKMWKPEKFAIFIFHIAFLLAMIGAAITRYCGYEGSLSIREGTESNRFVSSDSYISTTILSNHLNQKKEWKTLFSSAGLNRFSRRIPAFRKTIQIESKDYFPGASEILQREPGGTPHIRFDILWKGEASPSSIVLGMGEEIRMENLTIGFESGCQKACDINFTVDDNFFLHSKSRFKQFQDVKPHRLFPGDVFSTERFTITIISLVKEGLRKVIRTGKGDGKEALFLTVKYGENVKSVVLTALPEKVSPLVRLRFPDDIILELGYGPKWLSLPFSVYLEDFVMRRYPGSINPSSYESYIAILDDENDIRFPYKIFLNNILEYRGYRFYQSSFDIDERGSILTVTKDPGKIPTYISYAFMVGGMLLSLVMRKSRFGRLFHSKLKKKYSTSGILIPVTLLFLFIRTAGGELQAEALRDEIPIVNFEHAEEFARLVVIDVEGRLKPVDTLNMDVLNKISERRSIEGIGYNQVILSIFAFPEAWKKVPILKVRHPQIHRMIDSPNEGHYLSFGDFFDDNSAEKYRIADEVKNAMRKPAPLRNKLDRELLKINENIDIFNMIMNGNIFRFFTDPDKPEDGLYGIGELHEQSGDLGAQLPVRLMEGYRSALQESYKSGDWHRARIGLSSLFEYQKDARGAHSLAMGKPELEILFNKLNLFDRVTGVYILLGVVQIFFAFLVLLIPGYNPMESIKVNKMFYIFESTSGIMIYFFLHLIVFIAFTAGLALRWYTAGHAPWSNGYESLVFISWTISLSGLIFATRSPFVLAATSLLTGISLFAAHLSWINPQITNLVPALKSFWLTLHVSVISASYGFLGLAAILGFMILLLFILRTEVSENIDSAILELNRVSEMTLLIGLILLSIGNLFGAVWANETWGRYWSWDAKESWTLITIMVYAALIHWRYSPGKHSNFYFAFLSVVSFFSVLMTYFGVNYYLSGLHTYVKGDAASVPPFVYSILIGIVTVSAMAFLRRDSQIPFQSRKNPEFQDD